MQVLPRGYAYYAAILYLTDLCKGLICVYCDNYDKTNVAILG